MSVLPPLDFIEAEDVRRRPLRVAVAPLPSLFAALGDAIGHGRNGTPDAWRDAIRVHLKAQDRDTLAPLLTRGRTMVPDSLVGCAAEVPGESFRDGIERIVATPGNVLLAELAVCAAAPEGAGWRRVERDPGRWLRRYVASLLRAWRGFGPIWHQGRSSLDREVERIGLASATDAQLELLDTLSPVAGVMDDRWWIECGFATGKKELPDDGLVLVPLVSGPRGLLVDCTPTTIARPATPHPVTVRGLSTPRPWRRSRRCSESRERRFSARPDAPPASAVSRRRCARSRAPRRITSARSRPPDSSSACGAGVTSS